MSRHERVLIDGPDGKIEVFVEGHENPQGIALIAHPHPLFGGTADNKVVTTLARAFREQGCITLRPNFRGVGGSAGAHDHGDAETEDLVALHAWARARHAALSTSSGTPMCIPLWAIPMPVYHHGIASKSRSQSAIGLDPRGTTHRLSRIVLTP